MQGLTGELKRGIPRRDGMGVKRSREIFYGIVDLYRSYIDLRW